MPGVVLQFVSRPRPGSDLATVIQIAKEAAVLWRKHGANVSYWSIIGGEVGNYAFVARYDSVSSLMAAAWLQLVPTQLSQNFKLND